MDKGITPKPMMTCPQLLDVDLFYLDAYRSCSSDFKSVVEYSKLFELSKDETLQLMSVLQTIEIGVDNASN